MHYSGDMIHHDPRWYNDVLKKLCKSAQQKSLWIGVFGQYFVRPSLHQPLGPVTIRRRSAAQGCAAAQALPCNDGERIMTACASCRARSFEQLPRCRAS